jgi:hypothetical protein
MDDDAIMTKNLLICLLWLFLVRIGGTGLLKTYVYIRN